MTFARFEKKYVITRAQKAKLLALIGSRLTPDSYGESTVCNLYFDTPDYRLIRASLERGVFKEKLRIRAYNFPDRDSNAFVEIKRKCEGVVYKRRASMSYGDALDYLCGSGHPSTDSQILREIDYFRSFYGEIQPSVALFYDRMAYYWKENEDLRLTFDDNVRYRCDDFDLSCGDRGAETVSGERIILEIKLVDTFPLWLSEALDSLGIYPASFSKYGTAFQDMQRKKKLPPVQIPYLHRVLTA